MRRAISPSVLVSALVAAAMLSASCASTPPAGTTQTYNYRALPQKSLRGELIVVAAPDIRLNGKPSRLAPGSRIHGENNAIVMATTLTNQRLAINYTVDLAGQVQDVWILSEPERRVAWPRTSEESLRWEFDPNRNGWIVK
jgi:hypothetical protein